MANLGRFQPRDRETVFIGSLLEAVFIECKRFEFETVPDRALVKIRGPAPASTTRFERAPSSDRVRAVNRGMT
jgi:hypothetical protein